MLFLSNQEIEQWTELGIEILAACAGPEDVEIHGRSNLRAAFHYHAGTLLAANGHELKAKEWLAAGALEEDADLFSNANLLAFLERRNNRFIMPAVAFEDPRPFVHFAGTPVLKTSRANFVNQCGHSLPRFDHALRIMDIGCGNGALVVDLLQHLRDIGKVGDIEEILLIDPSPAMIELAEKTVGEVFPPSIIQTLNKRIENVEQHVDCRYDVALSSLAYHHMPFETKVTTLQRLKPLIDHFVIFEMSADNDTPELHTPQLACSVYQSYGRIIDFVFLHDAPVEVAQACVDCFLMTEAVSFFTQARGVRTDYHMLRTQWHDLFRQGLGAEFTCLCDSTCYADEFLDLFTIHYGRNG